MPHDFLRRTILPSLSRRVQVEGWEHVPRHGPYIIVANHQSYLDAVQLVFPLLVERNQDTWWLTTEHIWKFFGRFGGQKALRWFGMIPIQNSQPAESLKPALEVLRSGGVLGVFPEGMRNTPKRNPQSDTVMLKGKTGAARLAHATSVSVVPAGIVAPKGLTAWQALRNFFMRRELAIVRFGEPMTFQSVDPENVTKELLQETTRIMMLAVSKLCRKRYPY